MLSKCLFVCVVANPAISEQEAAAVMSVSRGAAQYRTPIDSAPRK